MRGVVRIVGLVLLLAAPVHGQSLRLRMLQAEDARGAGRDGVTALDEGLRSRDADVRRVAVRAVGRLEQAALIAKVAPLADDPDDRVQREAVNALGQLARDAASTAEVQALLITASTRVSAATWPVVAATLGRLPYETVEQVRRAETLLARKLPNGGDPSRGADGLLGATQGLEALVRVSRKIAVPVNATLAGLRAAAVQRAADADTQSLTLARRAAWLALGTLGAADEALIAQGLADSDDEVRRLAVAALANRQPAEPSAQDSAAKPPLPQASTLLASALKDANGRVRYEALRVWGRLFQKTSCAPLQAAVRDADAHVKLQAVDLLGAGCPADGSPASTLQAMAMMLTGAPGAWHGPAHAIVSLARVAPDEARTLLPRFIASRIWQVRMYAARAAAVLGAVDVLTTLAGDEVDNVRDAAVAALAEQQRPEAIAPAIAALARPDYQLIMTGARSLAPADLAQRAPAVQALLTALDRVTAEQRDTSRDPRMAILERLQALGDAAQTTRLEPYLRDFDARVAGKAAEVLKAWTGVTRVADPQPLPVPEIDLSSLEELNGATLRVSIAGKGRLTLRLLTDEAPLTVLRLVTRARGGYYNGLTFHRVAPNFVVQGGSPGANEYMGDARYMRDEMGLVSHRRGTVGISTRGRDTGDAQLFINLIDSPRLDHIYTVLAEVVDGMDLVDRLLEGDVIERIEAIVAPR